MKIDKREAFVGGYGYSDMKSGKTIEIKKEIEALEQSISELCTKYN